MSVFCYRNVGPPPQVDAGFRVLADRFPLKNPQQTRACDPSWRTPSQGERPRRVCGLTGDWSPPTYLEDLAPRVGSSDAIDRPTRNLWSAVRCWCRLIRGTKLDTGTFLDSLAKKGVSNREQVDLVREEFAEREERARRKAESGGQPTPREDRERLVRLVRQSLIEVAKLARHGTKDEVEAAAREVGVSDEAREYLGALLAAASEEG